MASASPGGAVRFAPTLPELSRCALCPRACGADRNAGHRGVCGAGASVRVARAALHHWEEPPISGEAGSGTVFFSHCPLHCIYCQNRAIANGDAGLDIGIDRLAHIFLELQDQGALNINLVTPTHYVPHIRIALDEARAHGLNLPIVYNTSGYEAPRAIASLRGYVDTFLTDLRYAHPETARAFSHAPEYPRVAREALAAMAATGARVIVRILLLPGHVGEACENVRHVAEAYGDAVTLSLMSQYTPVRTFSHHPELSRRVTADEYEELLDFADSLGIEDYFWQDGAAAEESFIPDFLSYEGVLVPAPLDRTAVGSVG